MTKLHPVTEALQAFNARRLLPFARLDDLSDHAVQPLPHAREGNTTDGAVKLERAVTFP